MKTTQTRTHGKPCLADLDKGSLAFYTGKWFLIWSFKFFCMGVMAAIAITVFLMACMPGDKKDDKS